MSDLVLTVTLTRRPAGDWVAVLDNGDVGAPAFTFGPAASAAELLEEIAADVERAELVGTQGLAALAGGAQVDDVDED